MKRALWATAVSLLVVAALTVMLSAGHPASAASKVTFPEKGKTITVINPFDAGGSSDVGTRLVAAQLEKELGTPVRVVNRPGASTQIGITELVRSKPDGYTLGYITLPSGIMVYLDPDRKAIYGRKDFIPLAVHVTSPTSIGVNADGPYKTVKDLIDAAKAKPEQIKAGTPGLFTVRHLGGIQVEQAAGVKFAMVHFSGGAPAAVALLGKHTEVSFQDPVEFMPHVKTGALRVLAILDKQENKYLPGVKTMGDLGYNYDWILNVGGWIAPAGTPPEVVDILAQALRKRMTSDEHRKEAAEAMLSLDYMDPAQFGARWASIEAQAKVMLDEAKAKQKK